MARIWLTVSTGQAAAALTFIEFVLTVVSSFFLGILVNHYNNYLEKLTSSKAVRTFTERKNFKWIINFIFALWFATCTILLESNLGTAQKQSSRTVTTKYWADFSDVVSLQAMQVAPPPRRFQLDPESFEATNDFCPTGISKIAMRNFRNGLSDEFVYPICSPQKASEKQKKSWTFTYNESFIDGSGGLKTEKNMLVVIPENAAGYFNSSDKQRARQRRFDECQQAGIALWPTLMNYSWDIGYTNDIEVSEVLLAKLCDLHHNKYKVESNSSIYAFTPNRTRTKTLALENSMRSKIHWCLGSMLQSIYSVRTSLAHECLRKLGKNGEVRLKQFKSKLENVSMLSIFTDEKNSSKSSVCIGNNITYEYVLIPISILKDFEYMSFRAIFFNEICPTKDRTNYRYEEMCTEFSKLFAEHYYPYYGYTTTQNNIISPLEIHTLNSDLNMLLPTKVEVESSNCEETIHIVGLSALVYTVAGQWESSGIESSSSSRLTAADLYRRYHAFLLSISRQYFRFESLFPSDKEESVEFFTSGDFTVIDTNAVFFFWVSSLVICLVIVIWASAVSVLSKKESSQTTSETGFNRKDVETL